MRKKRNVLFITGVTLLLAVLLFVGFTFGKQPEERTGLGETVDLSPDDKKIAFPYFHDGAASIYIADVDGTNVKRLTEAKDGVSHIRPVYSHDGKKILFLAHRWVEEQPKSSLWIMNHDGSGKKQLSGDDELITEAIFSKDDQQIYMIKAGTFENYSPIASKRPHEFDIYSMSVSGGSATQLTDQKEYDMGALRLMGDGSQLMYTSFAETQQLNVISIDRPDAVSTLQVDGEFARGDVYDPVMSLDGAKLVFSAVTPKSAESSLFEYELFLMNMETNKTEQLTTFGTHTSKPVFFHHSNKLLAVEYMNWPADPQKSQFWIIDLAGGAETKVDIEISEED